MRRPNGSDNGRNYTLHGNPIQHPPISSPPGSIIWRGTYSSLHACNAGNSPGTTTATVTAKWVETGGGGGGGTNGGSPSIISGEATGIAQADIPVFSWSFDRRMQYADGTSPITYTVTGSITGRRVTMTSYTIKALVPEWTVTPDPLSSTNNRTGKITSTNSSKSKMGVYYGERELARSDDEIAFAKVDLIVPPGPGNNGGTPLPEDRQPAGGTAPATNELNPGTFVLLLPQDQTNKVATTLTLKADPTGGSVTLDQHGLTDLKIYSDGALQEELTLPKTWTNGETPPSTLYMVGSSSSTNLQSAQGTLDLTYKANLAANGGEYSIKDTVGVTLLPVQIEARKQGATAAPETGLLVKQGDVLEFALAPQFFDTEDNFETLITWQQRQLKGDGTYTEWTNISAQATGTKFEHNTAAGGIFQIKAVITNGGEHEYKRKKDAPHGSNGSGVYNEKLKKDQPDFIGVTDKDAQISVRNQSLSLLGSTAYAKSAAITVGYGVDPTLNFKGAWKCNIFVFAMSNAAGVSVPTKNWRDYRFGIPPYVDRAIPPGANDWYSSSFSIPSWTWAAASTLPQPGFAAIHQHVDAAVAGGAHIGILDYDGTWISAGSATVNKSIHVSDGGYQPTNYRKP